MSFMKDKASGWESQGSDLPKVCKTERYGCRQSAPFLQNKQQANTATIVQKQHPVKGYLSSFLALK